jgi:predicted XRE-type DNA-binding protein
VPRRFATTEFTIGNPPPPYGHAQLAASLNAILAERKLTQAEAAQLLGVNQPKISALKGYKLDGFSVERLMHFATVLQHDVVIEIRPRSAAKGAGRG